MSKTFYSSFDEYSQECATCMFVCGIASPQYLNKPSEISSFSLGPKYTEFFGTVPRETFEERFNRRAREIREKVNKAKTR